DAQRFVPFAPNRHVIGEIKGIGELSPSTLAARQKIDVVVLNDILLLAVRRKRGNYSQAIPVADRAFNMADVSVEDLGDSPRMANLVKLVNRAETLIFAFAHIEAKKEFVMLIDHAKSTLFSLDAMPMPPVRDLPARSVKSGASGQLGSTAEDEADSGSAGARARFDEMLDALDIHIARREFDESTALVLKLKQRLEAAGKGPEAVREAVEAHVAELARLILADLLIPCSPRKQV
ncbi:exocyst complex component exo84, partial [Linderina pennispora]